MADVRPFQGVRYRGSSFRDLGSVLAPPYDIITPQEWRRLHDLSPYNVVRVEAPQEQPGDTAQGDRFARAAALLRAWLREGVLAQDDAPALYLDRHTFSHRGRTYHRDALFAAVRLEEWGSGVIRPHELTHPKPKQERQELLRACQAHVSPVMLLYQDPGGAIACVLREVKGSPPAAGALLPQEERHQVWAVQDRGALDVVCSSLGPQTLYVADGHHRYETALEYRNSVRSRSARWDDNAPANFVLAALVALDDPGLLLLPCHRLVRGLSDDACARLEQRTEQLFQARVYKIGAGVSLENALDVVGSLARDSFALLDSRGVLRVLSPRDPAAVDRAMPQERSAEWRRLAVAIAHELLLAPAMGMSEEEAQRAGHLDFGKEPQDVAARVLNGEFQIALFLSPVPVMALKAVSDAGERLPPKSTYFYPKLPTGVVLQLLDGNPLPP